MPFSTRPNAAYSPPAVTTSLFRFLLTGAVNTTLHTAVALYLLWQWQCSVVVANTLGFIVAFVFSFLVNTAWSFNQPIKRSYLIRFSVVSGIIYFCNLTISTISDFFALPPSLAVLAVALLSPPIGFTLHKFWTYKDRYFGKTRTTR